MFVEGLNDKVINSHKKLKNNSGSAMLLVIFMLALVTLLITIFTNSISNQMKSTLRAEENLEKKYETEGYIEEALAEFIESIEVNTVATQKISTEKTIGYRIAYRNNIEGVSVEVKYDEESKINGESGIVVKPNTNIDFILIINKESKDIDSSGKKYKYNERYKMESEITVKLSGLTSHNVYKISYEVNRWDRIVS